MSEEHASKECALFVRFGDYDLVQKQKGELYYHPIPCDTVGDVATAVSAVMGCAIEADTFHVSQPVSNPDRKLNAAYAVVEFLCDIRGTIPVVHTPTDFRVAGPHCWIRRGAFPYAPHLDYEGLHDMVSDAVAEQPIVSRFVGVEYDLLKSWFHKMRLVFRDLGGGLYMLKYPPNLRRWTRVHLQNGGNVYEKGSNRLIAPWFPKGWKRGYPLSPPDEELTRFEVKIDGHGVMVFHYEGRWHVVSGSRRAEDKYAVDDYYGQGKTILDIWHEGGGDTARMNPQYVYYFEVVHPAARVVVRYPTPCVTHLATWDTTTQTFLSDSDDIGYPRPSTFDSFEAALRECDKSGIEGVIAWPGCKSRGAVKMKTAWYERCHIVLKGIREMDRRRSEEAHSVRVEERLCAQRRYVERCIRDGVPADEWSHERRAHSQAEHASGVISELARIGEALRKQSDGDPGGYARAVRGRKLPSPAACALLTLPHGADIHQHLRCARDLSWIWSWQDGANHIGP